MKATIYFFFVAQIFWVVVSAQEIPLSAALNTVHPDVQSEKIHLHLDRPYYATGQTIWFKAYRAIVEGLDYRGKLGRISLTFVVR